MRKDTMRETKRKEQTCEKNVKARLGAAMAHRRLGLFDAEPEEGLGLGWHNLKDANRAG